MVYLFSYWEAEKLLRRAAAPILVWPPFQSFSKLFLASMSLRLFLMSMPLFEQLQPGR